MKIGFIGLGNVGYKLAGSLLRYGYDLTVRDVDQEAAQGLIEIGAVWADSGKGMAETCDVVITCLPSPAVSASIMKVATNYLAGVQLISIGEACMVAKKAGVDLGVAYEAIRI